MKKIRRGWSLRHSEQDDGFQQLRRWKEQGPGVLRIQCYIWALIQESWHLPPGRGRNRKDRQIYVGLREDPLRRSWLPAKRTGCGSSQAPPHLGPWDPTLLISERHVLRFDGSNQRREEPPPVWLTECFAVLLEDKGRDAVQC